MKNIFYLLLIITALGCKNKSPNELTSAEHKAEPPIEIRNFPSENHLFLDFYAEMNRKEVKETLKNHIGKSDIFKLNKSSKVPWRVDRDHLTELSESNIDSLSFFNGRRELYYQFSNGLEVYYAFLDLRFSNYSSLGSISLLLPDYAPQGETSAQRVKREFEKAKVMSNSIHDLYKKKYGNPSIEKGYRNRAAEVYYDVMNAKQIYDEDFHYLEDIYRYKEGNKLIEITHSLNQVRIVYLLNSDHIKDKREQEEEFRKQQNKKEDIYQKTIENI